MNGLWQWPELSLIRSRCWPGRRFRRSRSGPKWPNLGMCHNLSNRKFGCVENGSRSSECPNLWFGPGQTLKSCESEISAEKAKDLNFPRYLDRPILYVNVALCAGSRGRKACAYNVFWWYCMWWCRKARCVPGKGKTNPHHITLTFQQQKLFEVFRRDGHLGSRSKSPPEMESHSYLKRAVPL